MRFTNRILMMALLVAGLFAVSVDGYCWGQKGHDVTCAVAQRHLTRKAARKIDEILDGKTIVYWANWMDNASHTPEYRYTSSWHYRNTDEGETFSGAPLNENGDVVRAVYNLKLSSDRQDEDFPDRVIVFIDELNKYASNDVPKSSPILHQLLDITERGRSLGIVLFGAEQFVSDIHKRIKGNCATQAFGRTNAIEIAKEDFRFVPSVYKNMLTRLQQGNYIIQNPVFRSMLNIKFPLPIYKYYE